MVKRAGLIVVLILAMLGCRAEEPLAERRPSAQRRGPDGIAQQIAEQREGPRTVEDRAPALAMGQILYVPVYSHVYWGSEPKPFNLACTLSLRNVDMQAEITITRVDYYDTQGQLVGHYLESPKVLAPLETTEFYLEERDVSGGSGANFIVAWEAAEPVNVPVVEAVMIGIDSAQGISFLTHGHEIVD